MKESEARKLPEWEYLENAKKRVHNAQCVLDTAKEAEKIAEKDLVEKVCKFKIGQHVVWMEEHMMSKKTTEHNGIVFSLHLHGRWASDKKYDPSYGLKKLKKDGTQSEVNLNYGFTIPEAELREATNG